MRLRNWLWATGILFLIGGGVLCSCLSASKQDPRQPSGAFDNIVPSTSNSGSTDPAATFATNFEASKLNAHQKKGREIWFKATGDNGRFHAYTIGQRVGDHALDFGRILDANKRSSRFDDWGLINDPDCCRPGEVGCPAHSVEETYGFDWCPGDDELLKYVGDKNHEYQDPACALDSTPGLQSACDLKFGTSTGVIGFRKFPNPRFNAEKWKELTGALGSWKNYSNHLDDSDNNHLADGSIEPPFRVGVACASCHVSFDPVHPPADANHPQWNNLSGTIGNQYMYSAQVFGSGFSKHSLEWQMLTNSRPGTVDTSAVPNDQVNNPGTINSIINFEKRPTFVELAEAWRPVASCPGPLDNKTCACNNSGGGCYQKAKVQEPILHILKGGEDSVGPKQAVLRVHINIGVCAEQCWMNHLTELRILDPSQRNFGQTPFDIGQCRRDCPAYRALEDRVDDELAFLLSARAFDLYKAQKLSSPAELEQKLAERFGTPGIVERGRQVFTESCARCHSSQAADTDNVDFLATDNKGVRINWMGNDQRFAATDIGTYDCRSLHSNHMDGHVWAPYSSSTYKAQSEVKGLSGPATGGRGHYRAISLLSVWSTAPFMHNNAVGPEICGRHPNSEELYLQVSGSQQCEWFDPSIQGRLKIFEESMKALLHPETRGKKQTLTTDDIEIPVAVSLPGRHGYTLVVPKGMRVSRVGSFRHKEFVADFRNYMINQSNETLDTEMKQIFADIKAAANKSKDGRILLNETTLVKLGQKYSNCTDTYEDKGHTFGAGLPEEDKTAVTAFLETL